MVEKNTDRLWLTVGAVIVGAIMIFTYRDQVGAMAETILSKFDVSIEDVFNDESESSSDVVLSDSKVSYTTTWNMMMGQWIDGGSSGESYSNNVSKFTKTGNKYETTISVDVSEFKLLDGSDTYGFSVESRNGLVLELGEKDKDAIDMDSGSSNLSDMGDGKYQVQEYKTVVTTNAGDINESESSGYFNLSSTDKSAYTVFPVTLADGSTVEFVVNYKLTGTPVHYLTFSQDYNFDLKGEIKATGVGSGNVIGSTINLDNATKKTSLVNEVMYVTYELPISLPRSDMDIDSGSGVNIDFVNGSIKVASERDFNIMEMSNYGFEYKDGRIAIDDASTWVHESTSNDEQLTFDVSSPNRNQIIRVKLIVTIID